MKLISFGNLKGGTGKTALSFGISADLARRGNRILVIDCDPQGDMSRNFGVDQTISLANILSGPLVTADQVIQKTEIPGVDIIASSYVLFETALTIVAKPAREHILGRWLAKNGITDNYDHIICDTAPGLDLLAQNAFTVSDSIILVTDVDSNGLDGCFKFKSLWLSISDQLGLEDNIAAIVINSVNKNTNFFREFMSAIENNEWTKSIACKTTIPASIRQREATAMGTPGPLFGNNPAGSAMIKLVDELIEQEVF